MGTVWVGRTGLSWAGSSTQPDWGQSLGLRRNLPSVVENLGLTRRSETRSRGFCGGRRNRLIHLVLELWDTFELQRLHLPANTPRRLPSAGFRSIVSFDCTIIVSAS